MTMAMQRVLKINIQTKLDSQLGKAHKKLVVYMGTAVRLLCAEKWRSTNGGMDCEDGSTCKNG